MNGPTGETRTLCALLVDLENLHLAIKDKYVNASEVTMTVLQSLRANLKDDRGELRLWSAGATRRWTTPPRGT